MFLAGDERWATRDTRFHLHPTHAASPNENAALDCTARSIFWMRPNGDRCERQFKRYCKLDAAETELSAHEAKALGICTAIVDVEALQREQATLDMIPDSYSITTISGNVYSLPLSKRPIVALSHSLRGLRNGTNLMIGVPSSVLNAATGLAGIAPENTDEHEGEGAG